MGALLDAWVEFRVLGVLGSTLGCTALIWGAGGGKHPWALGMAGSSLGCLGRGRGAPLGAWVRFGVLGQHPWVPGCWGLIWGAE